MRRPVEPANPIGSLKDSHDRYASIEIRRLLQHMEAYRGLAILTRNRNHQIDQAFLGRVHTDRSLPNRGAFADQEGLSV